MERARYRNFESRDPVDYSNASLISIICKYGFSLDGLLMCSPKAPAIDVNLFEAVPLDGLTDYVCPAAFGSEIDTFEFSSQILFA